MSILKMQGTTEIMEKYSTQKGEPKGSPHVFPYCSTNWNFKITVIARSEATWQSPELCTQPKSTEISA
jgi:hypothetical protein